MKRITAIICLLFTAHLHVLAQKGKPFNYDYEIIYQYTFKLNKIDTTRLSEPTVLFCTDKDFYFTSVKNYARHEAIYDGRGSQVMAQLYSGSDATAKFSHHIFSRRAVVTTLEIVNNRSFSYEEKLNLNWKIRSDTMTINGYHCQSAELEFGGRHWLAWFAHEIPLEMGPYKFNGLPGLVLKITDTQMEFQWEIISFARKEIIIPWVYFYNTRNHESVNKKDYFDYRLKRLLDPYTYDVTLNPKIGKVRSTNPAASHQAWNKKVKSQLFQDNFIEIE